MSSIISSILDSLKEDLSKYTEAEGGTWAFCDSFGGDWDVFQDKSDFRGPGVLIYYTGSRLRVSDNLRRAYSRVYSVDLLLFDDSRRSLAERMQGGTLSGAGPGLWQMEDQITTSLQGARITMDGCIGAQSLPINITSTGERKVSEHVSVWAISLEIEGPTIRV